MRVINFFGPWVHRMWAVALVVVLILLFVWYLRSTVYQERATSSPGVPTAAPAGTVVSYHITGGIAGYDTWLYVDPQGGYTVTNQGTVVRQGTLDPDTQAQAQMLVQRVRAPIACQSTGEGNDLMGHTIYVNGYQVDAGSDLCTGPPDWVLAARRALETYTADLLLGVMM